VSFIDSLLQSVQSSLTPYVTSAFGQHGLLATTSIVATILGGVCNLAIAKVIDIWGRCEGFAVMIFFIVIGMIMKATCINVEMYAAANTIYWVGHIGVQYVISIIFADMTTLRNRLIMFGLQQTPIICSVFAGPRIAQLFHDHSNFRWAFGSFCFIIVGFAVPVIVAFILTKRKGLREGKFSKKIRTRSYWESTKHHVVEFDGKSSAHR
jgi:MFS family permease